MSAHPLKEVANQGKHAEVRFIARMSFIDLCFNSPNI